MQQYCELLLYGSPGGWHLPAHTSTPVKRPSIGRLPRLTIVSLETSCTTTDQEYMIVSERLAHDVKCGLPGFIVFDGDFVERIGFFRLEMKDFVRFLRLSAVRDGTKGRVNTTKVFSRPCERCQKNLGSTGSSVCDGMFN